MCCLPHTGMYVCIQKRTYVPGNAVTCPAELGSPGHCQQVYKRRIFFLEVLSYFHYKLFKFTFLKSYWKSQQSVRGLSACVLSKDYLAKHSTKQVAASLNPSVLNIKQEKITEVDSLQCSVCQIGNASVETMFCLNS